MTHASLFSGIGGPEVAAAMLGWRNAFHCEINDFGRKVLEYWFPDSVSYGDITETDFRAWRGKIDVLTGGFPCQPFSYAGKRGGAEDDRYLWPEMLRVISEVRPTWVVGENVAGFATMVEGGVFADLGGEATLFGEGDGVHRYELRETFTIERVCRDLEQLGYSVQPMLIPAAAVGAHHRRDRIFIIANANGCDDLRGAGEDEGESRAQRLQERHTVRVAGESSDVRSTIQGTIKDSLHDGLLCGQSKEQGDKRDERNPGPRGSKRICGEAGIDAADTNRQNIQGRHGDAEERQWETPHGSTGLACEDGISTHSDLKGLEGQDKPRNGERRKRVHLRRDPAGHDWKGLRPQERWAEFPTVSPVHRGNDGLPFSLDDLTISPSRWRTESLKAYGNAIVPQVMYQIFKGIETLTQNGRLQD